MDLLSREARTIIALITAVAAVAYPLIFGAVTFVSKLRARRHPRLAAYVDGGDK